MAVRAVVVNQIDEAFLKQNNDTFQTCPYCGARESTKQRRSKSTKAVRSKSTVVLEVDKQKKYIGTAPWLETHLNRCRKVKPSKVAGGMIREKKHRNALHDEVGRCMILDNRDGLCLVENEARRYVVAAIDLSVGCVSQVLQLIDARDLSEDQLTELISHLMAKAKQAGAKTAYRTGMKVEFKNGEKFTVGQIKRRHGLYCYVIEVAGRQSYRLTISNKDITGIVE